MTESPTEVDAALETVVTELGGERREGQHAMANAVSAAITGESSSTRCGVVSAT